MTTIADEFATKLRDEWLPAYCEDSRRRYSTQGFKSGSIVVGDADARDCLRAIDHKLVTDTGGGRYRAPRSLAIDVLFWEGRRSVVPRPITLWLEPVITFAALARLHFRYGWPKEALGMQSKSWAFDITAFRMPSDESPTLLGEVKKSSRELERLRLELEALSDGSTPNSVSKNSFQKWRAILDQRPSLVWLVGPNELEHVFGVENSEGDARLLRVDASALRYSP